MNLAAQGHQAMPEGMLPMLARPGSLPAADDGWAYEFKWDGIRAIVTVDGGRARASTRNQKDVTATFPELGELAAALGRRRLILDGEIVAFDDAGRPSFERLTHRLHLTSKAEIRRRAAQFQATFLAFDLLYLDGEVLLPLQYDDRRARLETLGLVGETFATPPAFTDASGAELLRAAADRGFEGVVAKQRLSPYRPGSRSGEWVKVKCFRFQEVVIGGWTAGNGNRADSLGALLLGVYGEENELRYVGKVGTGLSAEARAGLLGVLRPLVCASSPFLDRLTPAETADAQFVRPEIVGEVRYGEWTDSGRLRHPSWRGLRLDKVASEVVRES